MLVFPNCKINIGLHVIEKRPDGFHNLETVFYPVNWCDAIELLEKPNSECDFELIQHKTREAIETEQNLIYKAWQLIAAETKLPPIQIHLYKNIPMGAGLGGGSADAAFFIQLLEAHFKLQLPIEKKLSIASSLGSDCAFFIKNKAQFANGRGDKLGQVQLDLSIYYILIVYPNVHFSTVEAYKNVSPQNAKFNLKTCIEQEPIETWKNTIVNDFEKGTFSKYPVIKSIKEKLYDLGAIYASMSGSGSAVFGIFKTQPDVKPFKEFRTHLQKPKS